MISKGLRKKKMKMGAKKRAGINTEKNLDG